jgi:hypothetical protein
MGRDALIVSPVTPNRNRRTEGFTMSLAPSHRCMVVLATSLAIATGATLPAAAVSAKQRDHKTTRQHARDAEQSRPAAKPRPANSCADYGPGFVRIEGSDTCVKIGGSIGVGTGGTVR